MKHFFYAVVLLCYGAVESSGQYFNNFDSWPILEGTTWTQSGPGGTWRGFGTYVNFGNEYSGLRKVGFNNVGDILELPPVTNPQSVSFYGRLSSGDRARIALEEYVGDRWKTILWYNVSSETYLFFRGKVETVGEDIPLRLRMTTYGNSVFLDNLRVSTFVLPVELAEFTAAVDERGAVLLRWRTLTETGNERFDIQRSREGSAFETIGSVAGGGTTTYPQHYAFTDPLPYPGISYYRLRQVDFDGTGEFSPVRSVRIDRPADFLRIRPGVITDRLQVELQPATTRRSLLLFDRHGQLWLRQVVPAHAASVAVAVSGLPAGLYFLKVGGVVRRFVKI